MAVPHDDDAFDRPVQALREELLALEGGGPEAERKRAKLEQRLRDLQAKIYANLTPWQETLVARHPARPYTLDYIRWCCEDFIELHGDRRFADDPAIVGGLARFHGRPVVVLGHQKGRNARDRLHRNFGMPRPEGYRKAQRLMELADRFGRPVLTFIDTPGAYPGIEAEERGQAEAIATSLTVMAALKVPIVACVTGEGGSGGALALGVADRVLMLEHSVYSVISPEGCAAILWRDTERRREAAAALGLTAGDLHELGLVDEVVPEAQGGAHADPEATARSLSEAIARHLSELVPMDALTRRADRHAKFRRMGRFEERLWSAAPQP